MIKKVNIHYKRLSEFLSYLKEHDAEVTVRHKDNNGHIVPISYSFRKNEPNIKSLVCEAINENESIVNEYFRKNLEPHHISTRKRKIFFEKVNVIHDIQTVLPDTYDPSLTDKLLHGRTLDRKEWSELVPALNEHFYEIVTRFYWTFLFGDLKEAYFTKIPTFLFANEISELQGSIDQLRADERFMQAAVNLISAITNTNLFSGSPSTHYPDYSFVFNHESDLKNQFKYPAERYEREIPLDNGTCKMNVYGRYLFRDLPVLECPPHYLAQLVLAYYEYVTLGIIAAYLIKKEDIRFKIYTSTDGINIEYCKDKLNIHELADELTYYHFHKDPEKIFSKDLSHLLNEELKKNKTDNDQSALNSSVIKSLIQGRLIDTFSTSILKTFGFKK